MKMGYIGGLGRRHKGLCLYVRVAMLMSMLMLAALLKEHQPQHSHIHDNPSIRIQNRQSRKLLQNEESAFDSSIGATAEPTESEEQKTVPPGHILDDTAVKTEATTSYPTSVDQTTVERANSTEAHEEEYCTEPAYHEFPPDMFTNSQRRGGALIIHIIVCVYMFIALAVVCDDYFVGSLEKISEELHLGNDVAGATFMAAGSSAPELFTSIIGVFVAKGDVGVGTIVGSAVFNILFVIGLCGVLVTQAVYLTWWPLLRDSVFYSLSVIILISSIADSHIDWYEALIMLVLYVFYIIIMKFNNQLQAMAQARFRIGEKESGPPQDTSSILSPGTKPTYYGNYERFDNQHLDKSVKRPIPQHGGVAQTMEMLPVIPVDEYIRFSNRKLSFEDACFRFMKCRGFRAKTRFRLAVYIIICERRKLVRDPTFMARYQHMKQAQYSRGQSVPPTPPPPPTQPEIDGEAQVEPDAGEWKKVPSMEDGYFRCLSWGFLLPINILLYYTIPDCKNTRWEKWFMATFGLSIGWIAVFSYIMVWMVALIGYTLGIPDSIMGITFLAAGTSVPDAMASVLVAKQGRGDMAISNTIGSNVFDICIGLALPWFIKTTMVDPGTFVHINSNGMVFSVILLFLTVIITVSGVHWVGWRLNKKLGVLLLAAYALFLSLAIMIEFNVFGYVNAPMCYEDA